MQASNLQGIGFRAYAGLYVDVGILMRIMDFGFTLGLRVYMGVCWRFMEHIYIYTYMELIESLTGLICRFNIV